MATMIKINGRFIIPTKENIEKAMRSKLPQEIASNTVIDSDTPITIVGVTNRTIEEAVTSDIVEVASPTPVPNKTPSETNENFGKEVIEESKQSSDIEFLRQKFKEKLGTEVPVNKKNDEQWILSKL